MKTLAFGETLWDIFGESSCIGGAAFNVAAHIAKLGAESHLVSAVGEDELGKKALDAAKGFGIETDFIGSDKTLPTGTVTVQLSADGQPSYTIHENVAWDAIAPSESDLQKISSGNWDFFIFGTLAQRSEKNRESLKSILESLPLSTRIVFDINLRQHFHSPAWIESSMLHANILKINEDEAKYLAGLFMKREATNRELGEFLVKKFSMEAAIITLGGAGACAFSAAEGWIEAPGIKVKVADTVGAGDSFTAATLFALSKGKKLSEAMNFGIEMGGFVASKRGAVPKYSKALLAKAAQL